MRSLSQSLFILLLSVLFFACGRQVHPLSGGNLTIAQVPAEANDLQKAPPKQTRLADVKFSAEKKTVNAPLIKRVTKPVEKVVKRAAKKHERLTRAFQEQLTAAKHVKKTQEIRLVDILFFVILAILVAVTLGILHQVGVSTDMAIFIAMGFALVVVVVYIYLHTYIFTA
jgi:hypothetical protein